MSLEPRDIVVALKLHLLPNPRVSYEQLSSEIGLSSSTIHRAARRLTDARLLGPFRRVQRHALLEFLQYGVRYAFYARLGEPTRGMPTASGAAPLDGLIGGLSEVPVWPDPDGWARGVSLKPLDPIVPAAARKDPQLYELLALLDAIRVGQPRERKLAADELRVRVLDKATETGLND